MRAHAVLILLIIMILPLRGLWVHIFNDHLRIKVEEHSGKFALYDLHGLAVFEGRFDRSELLRSGDLEIDPVARTVRRDDQELGLTFSEFEILHKLAGSPRRVFTREELMNHLWDGNFYGDLRSVDVHVRHLRQKIEDDASNPVLIRTVRGVGYAFGGEDGRP